MVGPYDEGQKRNTGRCKDHRGIPKKRLSGEGRNDLGDDAKGRQDQDVHLRMTKEPEDVLEHHWVATAGRIKESGAKVTVREEHRDRTGQHRHSGDQQESRDHPCPDKERHLHECHAGRAHVHDGRDDIDRTQDGRHTQYVDSEDREIYTHPALHR